MINEIKQDAKQRMESSTDGLRNQMSKIRTDRACPGLLDGLTVSYYGVDTPLSQVAHISTEDSRTLSVTVFDKSAVQSVEKAILSSGRGLNPSTFGTLLRLVLPPLTEERRKDTIKLVRVEAEKCRVSIRNVRRDANGDIKALLKKKEISEDTCCREQDEVQKITNGFIRCIDELLSAKEKELIEI